MSADSAEKKRVAVPIDLLKKLIGAAEPTLGKSDPKAIENAKAILGRAEGDGTQLNE